MTSQSSSTKHTAGCGVAALLLNTLRRNWTTGLLTSIIFFFMFPVVVLAMFSDRISNYSYTQSPTSIPLAEILERAALEWSRTMIYISVPIFSILAVVIACIMLKYLHNRVSVDFYHSLPIKREKLLGVNLGVGYFLLLIPFVVMLGVSAIIIAANGAMSAEIAKNLCLIVSESVAYSLIFYALCALVGVATGLTSIQLILTAIAIFIIPALYATIVTFVSMFSTSMWDSWYTRVEISSYLSPVLSFALAEGELLSALDYVIYILSAAVILALAFIVYRRYKSERAGCTVIFPIVGTATKYAVMLLASLLGGMFFSAILENYAWLIFGMICGAVLTFMLSNSIINKSAKAMFLGLRGLVIFGISLGVVATVYMTNLFNINERIPSSPAKVEVIFDSNTVPITFRDEKVVDALVDLYNEREIRSAGNAISNYIRSDSGATVEIVTDAKSVDEYRSVNSRLNMQVVYYPKFGIPIAKSVRISDTSQFAEKLRLILDSEEFAEGYRKTVNAISEPDLGDELYWHYNGISILFKDGKAHQNYNDKRNISYEALMSALRKDAENIGYELLNQPVLGYFNLHTDAGYYVDFNLTLGMTETYELIREMGRLNIPADEFIENYAKSVQNLKVVDLETGKTKAYTSESELREIIGSLESLALDHYNRFQLAPKDTGYVVVYDFVFTGENEVSYTERESAFLYGKMPDFVAADFAK